MRAGDAATLEVSVPEAGTVAIADMGLSAAADPFTPARFDIFPTKPGRYPLRFIPAGGGARRPCRDAGGHIRRLTTIGVYGWDADAFMTALHDADVRLLLDVRQRRGVRGSEYAWANSKRLQAALEAAGCGYRHLPELAPTTELRRLQYADDDRQGVGKRSRTRAGARLRRALHERDPRPRRPRCGRGAAPPSAARRRCSAWSEIQRPATAR